MALLRRLLAPATAIWLFCQLGAAALVPVALWVTTAAPEAAECDCGHGPGAMCPMHKKTSRQSAPCAMRAPNGLADGALTTLAAMAGPITEATHSIQLPTPTASPRSADVHAAGERPVPPDPPPPRV